jgi:hypothetical protein
MLALLLAACTPTANVGSGEATIPRDSASRCGGICQSIGLGLESVVVMADTVGCVCRAAVAAPGSTSGASSAAGGTAAVMFQRAAAASAAAAQQQQQRQQQQQQGR